MLKARNIIIIFCLNYLLVVVASIFVEVALLSHKAMIIQSMMQTAGDMALEQLQISDDFFTKTGYGIKNEYMIKVPLYGLDYGDFSMFDELTGENDRPNIYKKMYKPDKLKDWIKKASNVTIPVRYYDGSFLRWYEVPKVWQMGYEDLGFASMDTPKKVKSMDGMKTIDDIDTFIKTYKWGLIKKDGAYDNSASSYYLSPISLGLTYFDEDYLMNLFINNMDLLMRAQYYDPDVSNCLAQSEGILRGSTYTKYVSGYPSEWNPINNGQFTLLRGPQVTNTFLYKGLDKVQVEYKVMDMYDDANEEMNLMLFGNTSDELCDHAKKNSPNGAVATKNPIIVAKVTFPARIIVPYTSLVFREMRSNDTGSDNFLDIKFNDNYKMTYTTFFAVTP